MSKKGITPWLVVGGGAGALVAAFFAWRKSAQTTGAITKALAPVGPNAPVGTTRPTVSFDAMLTHYWPFKEGLNAKERLMEGGVHDSNSQPLHTVEDFLAGKSDHVSISGDDEIFPYGQKVLIPWGNQTLVGRVTDTGDHFRGFQKVYRAVGREPLDVCVLSSANAPPNKKVTVQLVPGDDWAARKKRTSAKFVDASKFKGQNVMLGAAEVIVSAYFDALEEGL